MASFGLKGAHDLRSGPDNLPPHDPLHQVFLGELQPGFVVADKYYQASEIVCFICSSLTNFLTSAHTLVK